MLINETACIEDNIYSIEGSIAQIGLSSHDLEIGRGRRTRPKSTPACELYCHQCTTKVEDEIHFVIECLMYDDIRNELFFSNPNIPPGDKFITLFNLENKTLLYNLGLHFARPPIWERFIDKSDVINIVGQPSLNDILFYINTYL